MHMLIDARNTLYRAIYAVKADRRQDNKYHYITTLLRMYSSMINMYRPTSLSIFWDAPRKEVWRRALLPTYKDRQSNHYFGDISEELRSTSDIAKQLFGVMSIRQFEREQMEADDLIYAAISLLHPNKSVVVSSDSDMIQIPYYFNSCTLYDPGKRREIVAPLVNPVWQKALIGDKSDCIDGYKGIGPKKSTKLLESHRSVKDYLDQQGYHILNRNLLLIDLSLCPKLLHNKMYCHKKLAQDVAFDQSKIRELTIKYKLNGILQEFHDIVLPFKSLS